MAMVGKFLLRVIGSGFLMLAIPGSLAGGIYVAILITKEPVQSLINGPLGQNAFGVVAFIIVMIVSVGALAGVATSWLAFVAMNEFWRRTVGRDLFEDYDPVFWRE